MNDIRIRSARAEDLPTLAEMRRRLQDVITDFEPLLWRLSPEQLARGRQYYAELITHDTNRILVAADARDQPVGMIVIRVLENRQLDPARYGRIDDAWVEPDYRRQGVMRRLVRAAAEFIAAHGIGTIMLDFAVHNKVSEDCWRSLGFIPVLTIATADVSKLTEPGAV